MTRSHAARWILTALVVSLALTFGVEAQDSGHSQTRPAVEWRWFHNMAVADVNAQISQGFRPIDLEVERVNPFRFSAAFVANQGAYQRTLWWFYGTPNFVLGKANVNDARIIDIERYQREGETRSLAIMVRRRVDWDFRPEVSLKSILDTAAHQHLRVIDLEPRTMIGQSAFDAVMTDNTGSNHTSWWLYTGQTATEINDKTQQHQARLIDIEVESGNTFMAIMQQPKGPNEAGSFWWYYGLSEAEVNQKARQHAGRVTDVETYRVNGQKRFAVILLQNGR
ncbi:MAG: hypothetical protein ABEK03_04170 [Candidatus Bipolaricaulia bacterium]